MYLFNHFVSKALIKTFYILNVLTCYIRVYNILSSQKKQVIGPIADGILVDAFFLISIAGYYDPKIKKSFKTTSYNFSTQKKKNIKKGYSYEQVELI